MSAQELDALFIPYYYDIDRWHNDVGNGSTNGTASLNLEQDYSRRSRMMREGVGIDGKLHDFSRFLSWARYGSTVEYERYDSGSLTLLAGRYYLSFLRRHGYRVHSVNAVNRRALDTLGPKFSPRYVLISTTLFLEHLLIHELVANVRRIWPDAIVVLGGLFLVELEKTTTKKKFQRLLRHYDADAYVISSQGEMPLLEILRRGSLDALHKNPNIPNTFVIENGTVHEPESRTEAPMDLADNYVRWSTLAHDDALYHTVHTRTARSCAFKCSFCNFPVNQGALTLMEVSEFEKELKELKECSEIKSLIFTDDTFNVPLRRFKELCRVLADYDFEWYSFFRAQYADEETAKLMKEANCKAVFLGVESADDQILKNMNKVAKIDTIKRGVEHLKTYDIRTHGNFIVGFPGDTESSARKLVSFLDEMEVDFFTISPWIYVHSTPIHQEREKFGIEGAWNNWKHDTMTSTEAFDLSVELLKEPKYSVYAPDLAANEFWGEIMLYCNGFTRDEAQHAFRTFGNFMGKNVPATKIRASAACTELCEILNRREVPAPKNY